MGQRSAAPLIPVGFFLLAIFILFPFLAFGNESDQPTNSSNLVLLLQPNKTAATGFAEIKEAIDSHLGAAAVIVEIDKVGKLSKIPADQKKDAMARVKEKKANAAIWIDIPSQTVFIIYEDAEGNEQTLTRYFDCISTNLGQCADAIASAVTSALSVWTDREEIQQKGSFLAHDNELSPVPLKSAEWKEPPTKGILFADGGYILNFGKSGSFTHGAHIAAGVISIKYLSLEISGEFLTRIVSGTRADGSRVELMRRPFRIMLGGTLPFSRMVIGLSMGFMLSSDVVYYMPETAIYRTVVLVPGFALSMFLRFRILSHLGAWILVGMDTYSREHPFMISGQTPQIVIDPVQWRTACGLSLLFDIKDSP